VITAGINRCTVNMHCYLEMKAMNSVFVQITISGFEWQHLEILPGGWAIDRAYKVACACIFLYSKLVFSLFLLKTEMRSFL
jgi:hypothetical protein